MMVLGNGTTFFFKSCLFPHIQHSSTNSWYLACFLSLAESMWSSQSIPYIPCEFQHNHIFQVWSKQCDLGISVRLHLPAKDCVEKARCCMLVCVELLSTFDKEHCLLWNIMDNYLLLNVKLPHTQNPAVSGNFKAL